MQVFRGKQKVTLNGKQPEFKVDTGTDVTVIPPSLYYNLKSTPLLSKTTKLLMGPCKQKQSCQGTFTAELQVQDKFAREKVYLINDLESALFGKEPAERLKLISRLGSSSSDDYKIKEAEKHPKGTGGHEGQLQL